MRLHDKIYIRLNASVTFREYQVIQINCKVSKKLKKSSRLKNNFKYKLPFKAETKSKIF